MFRLAFVLCSGLALTLLFTAVVLADDVAQPEWGSAASPTAAAVPAFVSLPVIQPSSTELDENGLPEPNATATVYTSASYGSGGAAMRNRGDGTIGVSGVIAPVKAAFLYWAVITQGAPLAADKSVTLTREFPGPAASATINGTAIGSGAQPCWVGSIITVFRGVVPITLAKGNGSYRVVLKPGAGGSTAGGDPWVGTPALPLFEGASLVIVGKGTGTVILYDAGLAGTTFHTSLSYTLNFGIAASGSLTLFDNIGADGQIGNSRLANLALETTRMNGKLVAGPGSLYNDGDWNGSSGLPLPQLWDDTGHNITAVTPSGTTSLAVVINSQGDCLTPVANIVEIH
jgi:hypothetical protein